MHRQTYITHSQSKFGNLHPPDGLYRLTNGSQIKMISSALTTAHGTEIEFEFTDRIIRYLEVDDWYDSGEIYTSFHLILEKPIERRGKYIFSGKYMDEPFESHEIRIMWND